MINKCLYLFDITHFRDLGKNPSKIWFVFLCDLKTLIFFSYINWALVYQFFQEVTPHDSAMVAKLFSFHEEKLQWLYYRFANIILSLFRNVKYFDWDKLLWWAQSAQPLPNWNRVDLCVKNWSGPVPPTSPYVPAALRDYRNLQYWKVHSYVQSYYRKICYIGFLYRATPK